MSGVLGPFEQAVLVAILRLKDGAYGRAILREAQVRLKRPVSAGAIYATLDRLEDKGLTSSRLAAGTAVRGGRARRYYAVEAAGLKALNASRATAEQIWRGIAWPLKGRA